MSNRKQNFGIGNRTKDILRFLFFVLMCSIFWFVQELEETISTEVVVPVKLENVPKGIIITTDVPKQLRISVRDKVVELLPLIFNKGTDTLRINFAEYDNNEPTGHGVLLLSQLSGSIRQLLPNTTNIASMTPDTVYFYYNRGLHRRFPIRLNGTLQAKSQYCISDYSFIPDSVDVYAPKAMLDTMRAVYTKQLNQTDISKSFQLTVATKTQRGMKVFPDSVTLNANVDIMTRQSVEVPVIGTNFPADKALRTFPSTVRVSYLAPAGQSKKYNAEDFVVTITYAELIERQSSSRCQPHLNNAPEDIHGILIDPIEVDYLIENIESTDN